MSHKRASIILRNQYTFYSSSLYKNRNDN